jgi:hypothetical protein
MLEQQNGIGVADYERIAHNRHTASELESRTCAENDTGHTHNAAE